MLAAPSTARAQHHWKEIGRTSAGNPVYVDPATIKKEHGITHALLRVRFTQPVQTPQGTWTASHTSAMFDCAAHKFAVKENTYYIDEAKNKIAEHKVVGIPGYAEPLDGSLSQVATDYFCPKKK